MKNVEKMMKFCSKLGEVFEYPYYFNWSAPTNHRDNSADGEITDVNYVIFRVGMYPPPKIEIVDGVEYENGHQSPIEQQLFFAQTCRITDFTPFIHLMFKDEDKPLFADYPIKNFEDLENHKEQLKILISDFLKRKGWKI
jgi:hypothetical protein